MYYHQNEPLRIKTGIKKGLWSANNLWIPTRKKRQELLLNLFENAIKVRQEKRLYIKVGYNTTDDKHISEISDDGVDFFKVASTITEDFTEPKQDVSWLPVAVWGWPFANTLLKHTTRQISPYPVTENVGTTSWIYVGCEERQVAAPNAKGTNHCQRLFVDWFVKPNACFFVSCSSLALSVYFPWQGSLLSASIWCWHDGLGSWSFINQSKRFTGVWYRQMLCKTFRCLSVEAG